MTYDPIDTDNDGVVEADVNNQSVSTEEVGIKEQDAADVSADATLAVVNGRLVVNGGYR